MKNNSTVTRKRLTPVVRALALCAIGMALPASALASLPDARVYEQVSPPNKNGNVVNQDFGLAAEEGNAVVFSGSGAMGTSFQSTIGDFVARRLVSGWVTDSVVHRQLGMISAFSAPLALVPSSDFSRFLFYSPYPYVSTEPLNAGGLPGIYLTENPAVEPDWISRPTLSDPIPALGAATYMPIFIAGASPSLGTVYFSYSGTLLPQDESRAPYVGKGEAEGSDPSGFYEWSDGTLKEAGVLPDGTINPFGAVPAAYAGVTNFDRAFGECCQANSLGNEISADGSRAFFVSPDPVPSIAIGGSGSSLTSEPPELYVRKTAPDGSKSTVLVSQSQLPGHVGEPAGESTYLYASSDGSQAFFSSADQLTSDAPSDSSVKVYDFDVDTGTLTYLPGVAGTIEASSSDGSDFIFENVASTPAELDLWTAGSGGGHITRIAQLEGGGAVGNGRASTDGSVFAFTTNSPLAGGFNNAGGFVQVYRYDVKASALACVSCPPAGVTPSGDAHVSYDDAGGSNDKSKTVQDTRVISSDGSRVFFDSPDPLVAQVSNGMRNVYEWENGNVSLISSGKSADNSYLMDSSASGGDVFFTTTSGLVPGDVDGSRDAYDARIPRPGDVPTPSAVPCQGDVCQGPPSVPSLLGAPASATFSGAGNPASREEAKPAARKKAVKKKPKPRKRAKARKSKGKKGKGARKATRKNYWRGN